MKKSRAVMDEIIKIIKNSKRVGIFGHISPDGDCLGSMTALSHILNLMQIKNDLYLDESLITEDLKNVFDVDKPINGKLNIEEYDCLISLDTASKKQLGDYGQQFVLHKNTIAIDHHKNRETYASYEYFEDSASCCEIMYKLLIKLNGKIDEITAKFLYSGIVTDTQNFSIDTITSNTFYVVSRLLEYNFDFSEVMDKLFKIKTLEHIKSIKFVLEKAEFKNGIAFAQFKNKDLVRKGLDPKQFKNGEYVNYLLNVEGIKIAYIISQKDKNSYKISFRSKKSYDVSLVANSFNGGGHKQASGGQFENNFKCNCEKVYQRCLEEIIRSEKEINNV